MGEGEGFERMKDFGSASSSVCKRLFEQSDYQEKEVIFMHAERREEKEKNNAVGRGAIRNRKASRVTGCL